MSIRAGYETVVKINGASVAFEYTSSTEQNDGVTYILNATRRSLDPSVAVSVYSTESWPAVVSEGYSVDYIQGAIVFDETNAGRGTVTVSGNSFTMSTVATASSLSVNENCDLLDITPFNSTGHRKRKAGLLHASGTITEFDVADEIFIDSILNAEFLVLEIYEVSTAYPKRYWAVFESSELQAAVEGAQSQVLAWQSTKEYGRLIEP